jgi:hypothetical protein
MSFPDLNRGKISNIGNQPSFQSASKASENHYILSFIIKNIELPFLYWCTENHWLKKNSIIVQ